MSNTNLTFSSCQLSSRHCKPHFKKGCHTVPYQGIRFFEKKFHPSIQHNEGRKMGVKNPKNFTPKLVLDTNSILKSVVDQGHWVNNSLTVTSLPEDGRHIKSTLRYQKNFYTRDMSHMGACFWKWKIQKIGPPKSFYIQTRFSKIIIL